VIAAVNGICCGGGLEWALSADIILAADHASFALPEIRSGTVADAASIKVPKRIPYHIAMELLLTGRWFDVQEAKSWGLVRLWSMRPLRKSCAMPKIASFKTA
jgi:crotonobetainyl-CoA hydratase